MHAKKYHEIRQFCNVGIAALHRAVGLQSNYKTAKLKPIHKLDELATGCYACPYRKTMDSFASFPDSEPYRAAQDACTNCPKKVYVTHYEEVVEYKNEKNRYGYQERLSSSALRLYLLYHFIGPDKNGIIKYVDVNELAAILHVSKQTIVNNNIRLIQYGYICTSNAGWPGMVHVCITNYKDMYKNASEGGRGFITMNADLLDELNSIRNINLLRITIKSLLEAEYLNAPDVSAPAITQDYNEIRRYLPTYCKPNVIRACLDRGSSIFEVEPLRFGVRLIIKNKYNAKKIKKDVSEFNRNKVISAVDVINAAADGEEVHQDMLSILPQSYAGLFPVQERPRITLSEADISSIANISLQYGLEAVLEAIMKLYMDYICSGESVRNVGGLVRKIITSNIYSSTGFEAVS